MEIAFTFGLVCGLALLAARWGADSRESLMSAEQRLAALGMTWGNVAEASRHPSLRWRIARVLRRVATWLEAEPMPVAQRNSAGTFQRAN